METQVLYTHASGNPFEETVVFGHGGMLIFFAPFFDFGPEVGMVPTPLAAIDLTNDGRGENWRFAGALLVADLVGVRHSGVYVYGHFLGVPLNDSWTEKETVQQVMLSCDATYGEFDFAEAPFLFKGDIFTAELKIRSALSNIKARFGILPVEVYMYN